MSTIAYCARIHHRRAIVKVAILIAFAWLVFAASGCSSIKELNTPDAKKKINATLRISKEIEKNYRLKTNVRYQIGSFNGVKTKRIIVIIDTSKTENELKDEIKGITKMITQAPEFSDCDAMQIVLSKTKNYGVARSTRSNSLEPVPIKNASDAQSK